MSVREESQADRSSFRGSDSLEFPGSDITEASICGHNDLRGAGATEAMS